MARASRREDAFHADNRSATVRGVRLAAGVGTFFVPLFYGLDYLLVPEHATGFLALRLVASAVCLVCIGSTFLPSVRRFVVPVGYVACLATSLSIAAMVVEIDPGVSTYYAGLNLCLLAIAVLFPWHPLHTVVISTIIVVAFVGPVAIAGGSSAPAVFANNTFFVVTTAAISSLSAFTQYNEHRRRFDLSWSLEMRSRDLAEANDRLREVDELKSRFFANVSHELRTPLTLALSPVESLLTDATLPEGPRELLLSLHVDLQLLHRRIEDLIDLARLDSGKMELEKIPVDLIRVVSDVTTAAKPFASQHQIRLQVDLPDSIAPILGDAGKIEQVIFNLVSNAMKFSPKEGLVLVSLVARGDMAELTVQDNGPGLSDEEQADLFVRFGRTSGTAHARGSGLGLAIAKELTELQGGTIDLESRRGEGAKFIVRIPLAAGAAILPASTRAGRRLAQEFENEMVQREPDRVPTLDPDDGRPLVLVVDDNPRLRQFVHRGLDDEFRVLEACDGLEALSQLEEHRPLVVVCDMMMPNMDGSEFLATVRADSRWRLLPVLLLTAHGDAWLKDEALELGASDFLTKPFSVRELRARVKNFVAMRSAQMSLAATNDALAGALGETRTAQSRAVRAEKLAAIGQIASGIGHEVKNPVNFVLNFARPSRQRLERIRTAVMHTDGGAQIASEITLVHDAMGRIIEGSERIVAIVNGLQAFARGGDARVPVRLDDEVRAIGRMTETMVPPGIKLVLECGDAGIVLGSPIGIGAVAMNLVSNAFRACRPGGTVRIGTRGDHLEAVLEVEDDGEGIPDAIKERIWDPFFTTRTAGDGLGLGLALVQRIVHEDMGGRIEVESQLGRGTKFSVFLPREGATKQISSWSDISATA